MKMLKYKKTCIVVLCICISVSLWLAYRDLLNGEMVNYTKTGASRSRLRIMDYPETTPPILLSSSPPPPPVVRSPDGQVTSLLKREDHYAVPLIVHFVWFGEDRPMQFHHVLSVKSAYKLIKPDILYVHCDYEPVGSWWRYIKKSVTSLRIQYRTPPDEIFGNQVILPEHKSDIARIQILMEYGGIYMDFDVIALRPFDNLRYYNMTMGLEYFGNPGRLNNGVIVANKHAEFLRVWYEHYKDFTKREWDYHDCIVPYELMFLHPHLIHVEEKTMNYPGGKQLEMIYNEVYDWHNNYALHLWHRLHEFEHNPQDIKPMNTTFGQIARFIYYGNATLMV